MDGLVVERRDDFADAISKTPQYGDYLVIGKPDRDFLKTYITDMAISRFAIATGARLGTRATTVL
jgi:hypothetical protein